MLSTIHSFQSVVALRDSIVKNICFYTKKHKTTARTPLLCAFNIYCFIKLIHNSSDFSRMTIISITNLNTITRVAGMNYHTAANIHRNVVNTASVAVEEQIARLTKLFLCSQPVLQRYAAGNVHTSHTDSL